MPFLRIERGQEIVELARLGVEIDLGGQPFDQPVELVGVLLHEPAGIGDEMLRLTRRGLGRENVGHQRAHLVAIERGGSRRRRASRRA